MTLHEKAVDGINHRIERLQANLREANAGAGQQFLLQSILISIGAVESYNDYLAKLSAHAQRRHAELKKAKDSLETDHATLLGAGRELLERLKGNPTDRVLRKEIEEVQKKMAAAQKAVRRGADTLKQELAASVAIIDPMAENLRRFSDAAQPDALRRVLRTAVGQVRELYSAEAAHMVKGTIAPSAWESLADGDIEQAADFYDAYARAGYQLMVVLELITLVVSEDPPALAADAIPRANVAAAMRLKSIAARYATSSKSPNIS